MTPGFGSPPEIRLDRLRRQQARLELDFARGLADPRDARANFYEHHAPQMCSPCSALAAGFDELRREIAFAELTYPRPPETRRRP